VVMREPLHDVGRRLSVVSDTQWDRRLEVGGNELEESTIEVSLHWHCCANLLV
jgi:hypothetical protein